MTDNAQKVELPCICEGNWRLIVSEVQHLLGKTFTHKRKDYVFFGLVHGSDDYYYGMWNVNDHKLTLLTCVGNLETHEFILKEEI